MIDSKAENVADALKTPISRSRALGRRGLREEIRDRLIDQALSGVLEPGARIVRTRIAEGPGVSQSPAREALRDFELLGFVVSSVFRCTQVCRVSNEELIGLYPIRAALERATAHAAATSMDELMLVRLEELTAATLNAAFRGDATALMEADTAFHQVIVDAADNRILKQFWEALRLTTTFISVSVTHIWQVELAERNVPVLAALRGHDPEIAEIVMRKHIEGLGESILRTRWQEETPMKPRRMDQS